MRKRKKLIVLLVVNIIIFLVVGYAVLTSNLAVNGNFTFTNNNWDVHFENLEVSEDSITAFTEAHILDNDNTKIDYSINLSKPGDSYVFFVDVVNRGTVDGMISNLTNNQLTTEQQKYLTYDVTYSSGSVINNNDAVNSQSKVRIKVSLSYKYDIDASLLPSTENNLNLSLSTDVVLATDNKNQSTAEKLRFLAVTSGDGLYKSSYEDGRYIYRGTDPNNYVSVDGELWRIISVEADGTLKIVRKDSIGKMQWDTPGNRDKSTSTYCSSAASFGCNAWASNDNLDGKPAKFVAGIVVENASLNNYLNDTFFKSLSFKFKNSIVSGKYLVGIPGTINSTEDINAMLTKASTYIWYGKVGLINIIEYLEVSLNSECISLNVEYSDSTVCSTNNWLDLAQEFWTISPSVSGGNDGNQIWYVHTIKDRNYLMSAEHSYDVFPVVYLDSSIKINGSGTSSSPYIIS